MMDLYRDTHTNILFPQWQGSGPDNILFHGAKLIRQHLGSIDFKEILVPENSDLSIKNHILGYSDILSQLKTTANIIKTCSPQTILTIGGDCGVELAPVSYLNHHYNSDMALVWFDAHGDLNTPASSPSGHFHGMPLRSLCGQGDAAILDTCFSTLKPAQVILAGARAFDPPEKVFIKEHGITEMSARTLNTSQQSLTDTIVQKGYHNVYIHIDLDVLDPNEYKTIKHPTPGGINPDTLYQLIGDLKSKLDIAGLGIVEFAPNLRSGPDQDKGLFEIKQMINIFS